MTPLVDVASAGTLSLGTGTATAVTIGKAGITTTVAGALTVTEAATFNDNITVAAGKYLTLTGSGTRPGSPTDGMMYYDTTQKRLLVYNATKAAWQADRTDAILVAASNSTQADKDAADYITDGDNVPGAGTVDGDQIEINAAMNLSSSAAKKVVLLAGTYTIDASVSIPNNVTLSGVGKGTLITISNSFNGNINLVVNSDSTTGTGVNLRDLSLNGNASNQTSWQHSRRIHDQNGCHSRIECAYGCQDLWALGNRVQERGYTD